MRTFFPMIGLLSSFFAVALAAWGADRPARSVKGTRSPVLATNGIVATSQPLASAAGLAVLQRGGNAVDAALAAAAVLWVVEPMMVGPGGDLFAMVWDARNRRLRGLNSSGYSPAGVTADFFRKKGLSRVPLEGISSTTVPGAVDGWFRLLETYGTLKAADLLAPAIRYAESGFPVSEIIAGQWARSASRMDDPETRATYLLDDGGKLRAPQQGEIFRNPRMAATLKLLASRGPDVFYRGEIGRKLVEKANHLGWPVSMDDLAFQKGKAQWVEPISTDYHGYRLYELPPNGQGLAALEMLNILEGYDLKKMGHNSADYLHLLVEAKKLAWADRDAYVADPDKFPAPLDRLLSKGHAAELRAHINMTKAMKEEEGHAVLARESVPAPPPAGDTIYLTVVDRDRNAVSFINSLGAQFGSGIVAGDTGVLLHNRGGYGFVLAEGHPNCFGPRKRPLHTIIPAMLFRDGRPVLAFGVMGGSMQPQGHVQVLLNLLQFGMNVQEAGEAARFRHDADGLALESEIGAAVRRELEARGHKLMAATDAFPPHRAESGRGGDPGFGGYQGIWIDWERGVLAGGSDPRKDGCAIGW